MRGRNHRTGGGGGGGGGLRHHSGNIPLNRNHVFDSSGPDLRIRGTAQQLFEKYLQLGRDASSSGDRVMAESYFQHAEHYFRILNAMAQAAQANAQQGQNGGHQPGPNGNSQNQNHNQQSNGRRFQHEQRDAPDGDDDQPDPLIPGVASAPGMGEQPVAERAEREEAADA